MGDVVFNPKGLLGVQELRLSGGFIKHGDGWFTDEARFGVVSKPVVGHYWHPFMARATLEAGAVDTKALGQGKAFVTPGVEVDTLVGPTIVGATLGYNTLMGPEVGGRVAIPIGDGASFGFSLRRSGIGRELAHNVASVEFSIYPGLGR